MDFDTVDPLLSRYFASIRYWRKSGNTVCHLFINFKKTYDSVRREPLNSILIEFGMPVKQVRLIKIYSKETCSKVHIGLYEFISYVPYDF
jgi:hypothetical protein